MEGKRDEQTEGRTVGYTLLWLMTNKANRHKSCASRNQRLTDGRTDVRTDRPTKRLIESRARDKKWNCKRGIELLN